MNHTKEGALVVANIPTSPIFIIHHEGKGCINYTLGCDRGTRFLVPFGTPGKHPTTPELA